MTLLFLIPGIILALSFFKSDYLINLGWGLILPPFKKSGLYKFQSKFLFLFLLLWNGYGQLSAHSYKESALNTSIKNSKNSEQVCFGTAQKNEFQLINNYTRFGTEKQSNGLNIPLFEREEDDEFSSSKRHLKSSNYATSIFFSQIPGNSFSCSEKTLPFFNHFSYNSSYRYIIFRVFRV